jgi:hypothetical protein
MAVTPGRHTIRCYIGNGMRGDASITVDVPEGAVVEVEYQAPPGFFQNSRNVEYQRARRS